MITKSIFFLFSLHSLFELVTWPQSETTRVFIICFADSIKVAVFIFFVFSINLVNKQTLHFEQNMGVKMGCIERILQWSFFYLKLYYFYLYPTHLDAANVIALS